MARVTSEPQRVYAVLNPAARRFATVRGALVARASASGLPEPIVLTTTPDEPGGPQALHALARGADLVIAGGGDGTVREVASALAGTQTPLGLLPYGTANLFARNLGIAPRRLGANVATALFGRARRVDIGRADFLTDEVWTTEIPFLVVAGIGRDAATVLRTRPEFKRRLGWLAYFASGARQALSPPVPMRVARDDAEPHEVSTWCVLAGNCGRIPGGIRVFPRARPDDGLLDTLEVPLRSRLDWLPVAAKGVLRYPRDVYPLRYGTAQALSVRPAEAMPIHLDGDVVGEVAELRVRVETAALTVHVPH